MCVDAGMLDRCENRALRCDAREEGNVDGMKTRFMYLVSSSKARWNLGRLEGWKQPSKKSGVNYNKGHPYLSLSLLLLYQNLLLSLEGTQMELRYLDW